MRIWLAVAMASGGLYLLAGSWIMIEEEEEAMLESRRKGKPRRMSVNERLLLVAGWLPTFVLTTLIRKPRR